MLLHKHRKVVSHLLGLVLCIALGLSAQQTAHGSIILDYFEIITDSAGVTLEWATLSELDIAGFNIYLKRAVAAPSEYTIVATEAAQGDANVGYLYSLRIDSLEAGVAYCFRIEEIPIDDAAAEAFDRCGYGINITPTPTPVVASPIRVTLLPVITPAYGTPVFDSPLQPPTTPSAGSRPVEVPEPLSIVLVGTGIAAGSLLARRKKRR